jgi:hypothetical protein
VRYDIKFAVIKPMCAYKFWVICLRNDTACHWKVSRPLPFGLMQILKKKIKSN